VEKFQKIKKKKKKEVNSQGYLKENKIKSTENKMEAPLFEADPEESRSEEEEDEEENISSCFQDEDLLMLSPAASMALVERTPMRRTPESMVSPIMPIVFTIKARHYGCRQHYVQVPAYDEETSEQLLSVLDMFTVSPPGWASGKLHIVGFGAASFSCAWVNAELHVAIPDALTEVEEMSMIPYHMNSNELIAPNEAAEFKIQNTCGAWDMPMPRNLKATTAPLLESSLMRRQILDRADAKKKKRDTASNRIQQDAVHSIAGTFMVSKNKEKVDFRGVRSFKLMVTDFLLLLGNNSRQRMTEAGITCGIYMLLLRGNIGYGIDLKTHINYLMLRTIGGWTTAEVQKQESLVCDVINMREIKWDYHRWAGCDHSMVRQGKTSLETSRKGGTVMRIVFPPGTLWDERCEAEVLASCAALMRGMRQVLSGVI